MISTSKIATMVPTKDIDKARSFYEGTLGFTPVQEMPDGGVMYRAGDGTAFVLYPSQFAGTNKATLCSFLVEDIELEVKALRAKGVSFEEYDMPNLTTKDGVAWMDEDLAASWFCDPDGNILALTQLAPAMVKSLATGATVTA
jgi:catechol 2,3-dioxygenase-like lactoylglutathione lyase family enzyme